MLFRRISRATTLKELKAEWTGCQECRAWSRRDKMAFWRGNESAGVMVVGQGPGKDENETGVVYCGRGGLIAIDSLKKWAKIDEEDLFLTNIVPCISPGGGSPREAQVSACWDLLDAQINLLKPKLIITLGFPAAQRLGAMQKTQEDVRRKVFTYAGIQVIASIHPALIQRKKFGEERKEALDKVKKDMRAVGKLWEKMK